MLFPQRLAHTLHVNLNWQQNFNFFPFIILVDNETLGRLKLDSRVAAKRVHCNATAYNS